MHNLSMIAALDRNGLIGKANHLPWQIQEDLQYFRETTMGHPVVMGKHTWLSIGKPLDGRINIILTHDINFRIPGCVVKNSIDQVLSSFREDEIFVIGGSGIFKQFIPFADKLYLTRINHVFEGDTYFPVVNWSEWIMNFYELKATESGYDIAFERWERTAESRITI